MGASSVTWKGQTSYRPGVRSQTIGNTNSGTGAGARGVVALVGYTRGLEPQKVYRFASAGAAKRAIQPGCALLDAVDLVFNPTTDRRIPGIGAASIVVVGVNPATQAQRTFPCADPLAGLTLKSYLWGSVGSRIGVKIAAAGTHPVGRKVTALIDGETAVIDNLGGEICITLRYTGGEASTATATVVRGSSGYVDVQFTKVVTPVNYVPDATKMSFDGPLTLTLSQVQGAPKTISITGSWQGTAKSETIAVGAAVTGPFTTVNSYDVVTSVDCSGLIALTDTTIAGSAAKALYSSHSTVQNVVDYLTGKLVGHGYTVASTRSDRVTYLAEKMDTVTAGDIVAAARDLYAVLDDMVTQINARWDGFIVASEFGTLGGIPATTGVDPLYLSGGADNDSSTATADWTTALALLRTERITSGWVQSDSATIHEEVRKHVAYCDDRNEQFWFLGCAGSETKSAMLTRTPLLNNAYLSLWVQSVTVDVGGTRKEITPPYLAAMVAGMFAGRPIAYPLLWKSVRVSDVSQHSSLVPEEDADEMIAAGINLITYDNDQGFWRVERDVTTYRGSEPEFCALSASESVAESKRDMRTFLKAWVGEPNFAGGAQQVQAAGMARLRRQADRNDLAIIKVAGTMTVDDGGDTYDVTYTMAATEPTTFVNITQYVSRYVG